MQSFEIYLSLMQMIRARLDVINALKESNADDFTRAETAAFHGRKIVEAIAFGCLVATEHGLKTVPRDAKGQWNAEDIFKSLQKKRLSTLPSPSTIRSATDEERSATNCNIVIDGQPDSRLTHEELIDIYRRLHSWLHEVNPYTNKDHSTFYSKHASHLWEDLAKLDRFLDKHFVSIHGAGFFCVLHDNQDGKTKVVALDKVAA